MQTNQRSFTSRQWLIGGTVVAILCAGILHLLLGSGTGPSGVPHWVLVAFTFFGLESGTITFWLAARVAGHNDVPIR